MGEQAIAQTRAGAARGDALLARIGQTPLLALPTINRQVPHVTLLAKAEWFNPGGSVKDRAALAIVEAAEASGALTGGKTLLDATSGNTGVAYAMIGAVKGYRVILTMPETMSAERIHILKGFGAEVLLTPAGEGMVGAVKKAEAVVRDTPGAFMPQQFINPANPEVHRRTTAQEILRATEGEVDAFVAGVGTGGTVTGVGEVLKKKSPHVRIVAVEPAGSPVLSGGAPGPHMIQGIGAGFVPDVLNRSVIDTIITVSDEQAYETSRLLANREGLLVGISAGAACWAALRVARDLGQSQTVVVVFPDTGERYLSLRPYFEG